MVGLTSVLLLTGCVTYWEDTVGRPEHVFHRELPLDLEACERQFYRKGSSVAQQILLGPGVAFGSEDFITECMRKKGYRKVGKDEVEATEPKLHKCDDAPPEDWLQCTRRSELERTKSTGN